MSAKGKHVKCKMDLERCLFCDPAPVQASSRELVARERHAQVDNEAQACHKDALYVGVDVVRCRRNGLANAPFPLPIQVAFQAMSSFAKGPFSLFFGDPFFWDPSFSQRLACLDFESFAGRGQMLDGRVLGASQAEYEHFGKTPARNL